MTPWWQWAVLALYYGTLGVLALFGIHRLVLLAAFRRYRSRTAAPPPPPERWPRVTVQLPLYNERFVAARLLRAVAALDYPRSLLEIQVLDDSSDETSELLAGELAMLRARGLEIVHLRRASREGFKAGALAAGLRRAGGELVAIFDADFVPPPEFLRRTVPCFADPAVGMVQARWGHLNRDESLLTRTQAVLLDGHFVVEHFARHRAGCFFNFNGTAGVWRRAAIERAGGWQADTLTEDLDLSYRAQLAGLRFVYLADLEVPAELPADVNAFKSQQRRWARGAIQTARKLLPRLLAAPLPWRVRLEAAVHLTNNLSYPLMVLLALLVFPAMVARRGTAAWQILALDLPLFAAATCSVLAFYVASQRHLGRPWREVLPALPGVMACGIGLSVTNTPAVLGGLVRSGGTFHRTPKLAGARGPEPGSPYRLGRAASAAVETTLALWFVVAIGLAAAWGMWSSIPFLWLFLHGYGAFALAAMTREPRRPVRWAAPVVGR